MSNARRARNIEPFIAAWRTHAIDWDQVPLDLMTNSDVTAMFGAKTCAAEAERKRRGDEPDDKGRYPGKPRVTPITSQDWDSLPLGKMDDQLLAFCLRVRADVVTTERQKRNIPAWTVDMDALPYGRVPDPVIAANNRLHKQTVIAARQKRGIEPYHAAMLAYEPKAA